MISLLRHRDFFFLWIAQVSTQVGANLLMFVLALRLFERTASNAAVGFLMLMFGLPTFIFGLWAGIITERFNKVNIVLLVNLLLFLLALLFFFSSGSIFIVYFLVFIFSLCLQFFFPSVASLIPLLVGSGELLSANSLFTMTLYSAVILGYVGAGPLLRFFGPDNIFLFAAGLFLFSALSIKRVSLRSVASLSKVFEALKIFNPFTERAVFLEVVGSMRQTLSLVKLNGKIRRSLALLVFSQMIISILLSLSPGFAATVLRLDVAQSSVYVILPAALGMFSGSIFLGLLGRRWRRERLIRFGLFSIFLFLFILSSIEKVSLKRVDVAFLAIFIFGLANSLIDIPANTTLQEAANEARGRLYGLLGSLVYGFSSIPLLVVGLSADRYGVNQVIFAVSLVALSAFFLEVKILNLLRIRGFRKRE